MTARTNKAWAKRLKLAKRGVLVRASGQNHYNAKENAREKSRKRKIRVLGATHLGKKAIERFVGALCANRK